MSLNILVHCMEIVFQKEYIKVVRNQLLVFYPFRPYNSAIDEANVPGISRANA